MNLHQIQSDLEKLTHAMNLARSLKSNTLRPSINKGFPLLSRQELKERKQKMKHFTGNLLSAKFKLSAECL